MLLFLKNAMCYFNSMLEHFSLLYTDKVELLQLKKIRLLQIHAKSMLIAKYIAVDIGVRQKYPYKPSVYIYLYNSKVCSTYIYITPDSLVSVSKSYKYLYYTHTWSLTCRYEELPSNCPVYTIAELCKKTSSK